MPNPDDDSADGGLSRHIDDAAYAAVRGGLSGRVLVGGTGQRYTVGPLRSEGGQGWVFLATVEAAGGSVPIGAPAPLTVRAGVPLPGETVIVKVLRADALSHEGRVRFHREAQVLRLLSEEPSPSPNVVRFHDYAEHELALALDPAKTRRPALSMLLPFTVLEYVPGTSLDQELARGPLPLPTVRGLLRDIADALEYVHARGVVHRDLKPANVLLAPHGSGWRAKITDFGLVRIVSPDLARTARIAGASVGYAPPEQYERGNTRVSPRTDVFSLAAVVFEMLSGRPAYPYQPGDPPMPVLTKILSGARPALQLPDNSPLRQLGLAAGLEAELHRALSPEPDARQSSARQFAALVDQYLARAASASREIAAVSSRPPSRRAADQWLFRSTGARPSEQRWRAAVFGGQGRHALVLGERSFELVSAAGALLQQAPSEVPFDDLTGLCRADDGQLFVFGQRGVCGALSRDLAVYRPLEPSRRVLRLVGALPWGERVVMFGAAPGGQGGIVVYRDDAIEHELEVEAPEVRCAASSEHGVLIFGTRQGRLVQWAPGLPAHVSKLCDADLNAVLCLGERAFLVGSGGHAVHVEVGKAQLESVQTTRDLHLLRATPSTLWAAGDEGRLLLREGRAWYRVDAGVTARVLALHAEEQHVELLCADGAFCRGSRVSLDP